MKRRLIIRFLLSNIILLNLMYLVFIIFNFITFQNKFAFTDSFYNYSFSPNEVTEIYMRDLMEEEGEFVLSTENKKVLIDNNIWIQVLDEDRKEIYSENKKQTIPTEYSFGELYEYLSKPWDLEPSSTLNIRDMKREGRSYTFIIGYPYEEVQIFHIGFTKEHFLYIGTMFCFAIVLTIIMGYLFSRKLASPISGIINDINLLADGKYVRSTRKKKRSIYKQVNENIVKLSDTLHENEKEKERIDKTKEQWIANMAHDLKTPLASINGYAQILQGDYSNSPEDVQRYGEIINDKTRYIEDLINDLTLVYKFKNKVIPMDMKEENMVEVLREVIIDILNTPVYEDRNIEIESDDEVIRLSCHKNYIVRAINNLLYNALVHNPKETNIKLTIKKVEENVIITIEDNGNGISEEDLKVLFDRYFRATNTGESHKGSGLGMAISKEIIEAHKGTINVESELGEGTKTTIILFSITE